MKKLTLFSFFLLFSFSLHAQSPRTISYQGMIHGASSGNHSVTLTLYSDASGTQKLWQATTNTMLDSSGVFNTILGSAWNPLPDAPAMDRPLWLGVSIDGSPELRPFSQLAASPFALNVADSSITSQKLNANYVSSISVDGQPITGKGTNVNIVSGPGLNATWIPTSSSLMLSGTGKADTGNKVDFIATNPCGTNSDGAVTTNTVSGGCGNLATASAGYATIGGGDTNQATGTYATVGGGQSNNAFGVLSSISGGGENTADADAAIGGGALNTAAEYGTISGGVYNRAGYLGSVGGGWYDTALFGGTVGGGSWNHADTVATVGGGATNRAYGLYSTIAGGTQSYAQSRAGLHDSAQTVGGGYDNVAQGDFATVGGGEFNQAGTLSAIPGGFHLEIGDNSFGFNGKSLNALPAAVSASNVAYFGNVDLEIASDDTIARQLRIFVPNSTTVYTSFQEPVGTSGIPVHYVLPGAQGAFGQVLTNDGSGNLSWANGANLGWTVTGNTGAVPPTNFLGTIDSNSLELHVFDAGSSSYGDKRVMGFYVNTTSPNILGGFHDNAVSGAPVGVVIAGGGSSGHVNLVKGSYGVISGGRENTDTAFAFVGGGDSNRAMGAYSAVISGNNNFVQGDSSVIAGGTNNRIYNISPLDTFKESGLRCFVGGGGDNAIGALGKDSDVDPTISSAIVCGDSNRISEGWSTIAGGKSNTTYDDYAFIGTGYKDTIFLGYSAIIAGQQNSIWGTYDFIGAGEYNHDSSGESGIVAGYGNSISGSDDFLGAGFNNRIVSFNGTWGPTASCAGILAGQGLIAQSFAQTVLGFNNIPQGESAEPTLLHGNDRLVIVGNGSRSDSAARHNAWELTNRGSSIVYATNGSGGATPNGFPPVPDSGAIYGARYMDNTPIAWGDVEGINSSGKPWIPPPGKDTVYGDFGIASVQYKGIGEYEVTLNTVDSYTGAPISSFAGLSIVTTVKHFTPTAPSCLISQVTQLAAGSNVFRIWIQIPGACTTADAEVSFQVFGRR